ncbi:MAG: MFS transporter [Chloroflexota bacterium]|nr:MFS transporter [Chloroflexota bacterium]
MATPTGRHADAAPARDESEKIPTGPPASDGGTTRGWAALDALHEPRFRRLWLAGLFVNVGRWLDFLVLGWLAYSLTGSPFMVGLAAFCRFAPMIVLGLFAGLLIDRFHRGRLIVGVQCVNLVVALMLALLFGAGVGELWHLIVLETVLGIAWAVDFPSRRAVLFTLVGSKRVTNAVSLESVSMQGTKIIGPLLGGVLLARIGPAAAYLILALLYGAALFLTVTLVRRVALPAPGGTGESIVGSLASGFAEARSQPAILGVLLITVWMNFLVFPYQQIMPVFARDVLHVGPEQLGLLVAAGGFGTLVAALWIAARRDFTAHRQVFVGGSMLSGVMVVLQAFSPGYELSLLIQFVIGLGDAGFGTMQSTIILLSAHERARGRVLGILSVCIGTNPLGALWLGLATTYIGAPAAFGAGAALALLLMAPVATRMVAGAQRPLRVTT